MINALWQYKLFQLLYSQTYLCDFFVLFYFNKLNAHFFCRCCKLKILFYLFKNIFWIFFNLHFLITSLNCAHLSAWLGFFHAKRVIKKMCNTERTDPFFPLVHSLKKVTVNPTLQLVVFRLGESLRARSSLVLVFLSLITTADALLSYAKRWCGKGEKNKKKIS